MTHEGFKAVMRHYLGTTEKKVNEFLDGKNNDPELLKWFNIWKTGNNRFIFNEIEALNEIIIMTQNNKDPPQSSFKIPPDANLERRPENKNVRK